jgi:hypothetical protein
LHIKLKTAVFSKQINKFYTSTEEVPITHVQLAKFDKKQGSESLLFHVPV